MSKQSTRKIADLIPYARNSRKHSEQQVSQIAASIKEFGFLAPVIIDGENGIIAGHGRVLAAQKIGMDSVPVVLADHLTDAQKRAYVIADNRLSELSSWDNDMLALELSEIGELLPEGIIDFDLPEISVDSHVAEGEFDDHTEYDDTPKAEKNIYPVIINLDRKQYLRWAECKKAMGVTDNVDALTMLMDSIA